MRALTFAFLLFTLPLQLWAEVPKEVCAVLAENLRSSFEYTYYDEYRPLMCADNVKKWSKHLAEATHNQPLQGFAFHVRHKWVPHYPVAPVAGRTKYKENTYKPPLWSFHAVAIVEGLVIDFDFTNTPRITGVNDYIQTMWGGQPDAINYVTQLKPLESYAGRDLYGVFDEKEFPSVPFTERAQELATLRCAEFVGEYK